jgi:hypothetical protein
MDDSEKVPADPLQLENPVSDHLFLQDPLKFR